MLSLFGARKLINISQLYNIFATEYKTTAYNEKDERYFLHQSDEHSVSWKLNRSHSACFFTCSILQQEMLANLFLSHAYS